MTTAPDQGPHIIRRQSLDVVVHGSEADGLDVQRRLSALSRVVLPRVIEQVLDEVGPANGHLYIERLEVDLGAIDLDRLETAIPERIALHLERSLRDPALLVVAGVQTPAAGGADACLGCRRRPRDAQHRTEQESLAGALVYFLLTGLLPWSFRLPHGRRLEDVLLAAWRQDDDALAPPDSVRRRLLEVLALAVARERLALQFSPPFLEALLSVLSPSTKQAVDAVIAAPPGSPGFIDFVPAGLAAGVRRRDEAGTVLRGATRARGLARPDDDPEPPRGAKKRRRTALAQPAGGHQRGWRCRYQVPLWAYPSCTHGAIPFYAARVTDELSATQLSEAAREGIFIDDAGLVLLHPFLPAPLRGA